jgi:hypothetical protein
MNVYRLLADGVVVVHTAYVGFVVVGMFAILLGIVLRWRWIGNFWFRVIHFLMIAIVVAESLGGMECPLTTIEDSLRSRAGETIQEGTFLGRYAAGILFYSDAPHWVFVAGYCLFGALVLATLLVSPPRRPRSLARRASEKS